MAGKRRGGVFTSSYKTLISIAKAVEITACRGPRPFVKPPPGIIMPPGLKKPKPHGKVISRALDIGLIVDASANVRGKNFLRLRNFLKQIVASFSVSPRATRFGVVEFSSKPRKLFDFNRFTNQATLLNVMGRIPFMNGKAKVGKALKYAAAKLFSRSTRKMVAIVIVAGKSRDKVAVPARRLRRAGIKVLTVGIGKKYSVTQLRQMATTRRNVFTARFKTLNSIVRVIKQRASKVPRPVRRPVPVRPRPGRPLRPRPRPRPGIRPRPRPRPVLPLPRPKRPKGGKVRYRYIGRYRTPPRLGRPARTITRGNPVSSCFRLARARRRRAFAIRRGRQCYLSTMTSAMFTRRGITRLGGLKVYVVSKGSSKPRIRPRPRRPRIRLRPRPRPMRRVWNYRRIGKYRITKGRASRGLRYLGTVKPRLNPAKQCSIIAREKRYRYFGVRSRRYCYGARTKRPLTIKGRTTGFRGVIVYKIGRGRFRPKPRRARARKGGRVWHYRWLGRFRSPKGRGLGKRLGRVTGRRKVYSCAFLAKRMRYRAFALRRGRVCYGTLSLKTYITKPRVRGRFRAGAGGLRFIDAYSIGKGPYTRPKRKGSRGSSRKRRIRAQRRKDRRMRRKRARIAKTKKLKRRLKRRLRRLRRLKRKQMLAARRVRRLRLLGKMKRLRAALKAKLALAKRRLQMKRRIRARKLRLKRRYYRLQAAKRRARMLRARKRAIRRLRMRAKRRMQKLRLLARMRLARARRIARLRRLRRFRMMAKLRARQQAQRRRMIALARKRMRLLRRRILLRQRAIRARFRRMQQRTARLRTLRFRVSARQRSMRMQLFKIRRKKTVARQRMSYYRRVRQLNNWKRWRVYYYQLVRGAGRIQVRLVRYQRQLSALRRRRRLLALRQQRAARRMREYQRKRWAWFRKQQQKLKRLIMKKMRRMRAGKKRGDILSHKPSTKKVHETSKESQHIVHKDLQPETPDLFWQFEDSASGETHDAVHNSVARFLKGAHVVSTRTRGHVATTSDKRGWISLGDFKGECFSDPDQCKHKGMTVMASLKLDKKQFHKKSSSYFLSSGGQTTRARGFAFLHLVNRYIIILSTHKKQWKLETRDLPQGWFNVAFTWKKDGLLKLYVNGKEVASGTSIAVSRPKDEFSTLEIGRPNNSLSPIFRVPLEIDDLALWEKTLTSDEISALAKKDEAKTTKEEKKE